MRAGAQEPAGLPPNLLEQHKTDGLQRGGGPPLDDDWPLTLIRLADRWFAGELRLSAGKPAAQLLTRSRRPRVG